MARASTKRGAASGYAQFEALSDAEKERVWQSFNREIPRSELRPLTPAERRLHGMPATPRKRGGRAKAVSVTIDPRLLRRADAYAKANGLTRAEVVSRGLSAVVDAPAGNGTGTRTTGPTRPSRRKAS